jgi:hypothetical protein
LARPPRSWKKPRKPINIRDISKVRVDTQRNDQGVLVYPEFFDGEWKRFYQGDKPLVVLVRLMRINGVEIGNSASTRLRRTISEWEKWLRDLIRDNHLDVKLVKVKKIKKKPLKEDEEEDEEEEEEEEELPVTPPTPDLSVLDLPSPLKQI